MKLIVGLGNPGPEYGATRHNIGFMVADRLAERLGVAGPARNRFHAAVVEAGVGDERIMLMKPLTFMNRSGLAVGDAVRFYKMPLDDLLIMVDEVALPMGQIRLRAGGSDGGHNGLADVERALGAADYPRMRIGVDAPPRGVPRRDYVLGRFTPDQQALLPDAIARGVDAALMWAREGLSVAMNHFNRKTGTDETVEGDANDSASPQSRQ